VADPIEELGEGLGRVLAPLFAALLGLAAIAFAINLLGIALQSLVSFLLTPAVAVTTLLSIGGVWFLVQRAHQEKRSGQSERLHQEAVALTSRIVPIGHSSEHVIRELTDILGAPPSPVVATVARQLYAQQDFAFAAPPTSDQLVEHAAYRDAVRSKMEALSKPDAHRFFVDAIVNALGYFQLSAPSTEESSFTVPAIDLLPDVRDQVRNLLANFFDRPIQDRHLFSSLRHTVYENMKRVSERRLSASAVKAGTLLYPADHPGTAREIVDDYLTGTPLHDLFFEPIPCGFPQSIRFEHMHLLAGSGHGKTQTLQHLILSDLASPNPPSLVIIDSQGDMLRKLSRLALFDPNGGALASRLIIIDPADIEHPPALNMFDVNLDRLKGYGPAAREQILNGVIELYDYMFGSLLGAELTQKQSVIFRYLARLMLTIPQATIHDLLNLLGDATPYLQHIEKLQPGARMFFETEFPHKSFTDTKRQIQRRLWGILENPTFERMLIAPKNRIDMFDALNSGKIVLVNTAKDFLKAERSSFLGRFFIALTLQAALERAALPEDKRRPSFLYIDEAADYFDENIDDLLTQARKYSLGVVFSHQYLDQLAPGLRSSIASNTSVKLAGGVSDRDARSMAPDMRTTPTFILEQHKRAQDTQFACYVRNRYPSALSISIPFGSVEAEPTMTDASFAQLLKENRARVSVAVEPSVTLSSPDLPWKRERPAEPVLASPVGVRDDYKDWSG
jgi:hypothetical protein